MAGNMNENRPSSAHYETPNEYVGENIINRANNRSPLLMANRNQIRNGERNEVDQGKYISLLPTNPGANKNPPLPKRSFERNAGMTVNFSNGERKNRWRTFCKKAALATMLLFLIISNIYCIYKVNNPVTNGHKDNKDIDFETQDFLNKTIEHLASLNNSYEEMKENRPKTVVGMFKWEFKTFTALQKEAQNSGEQIKVSDPFVTHNGLGYKLQILLYPNGYDKELKTYVAIAFEILHGELDDYLEWPFSYKISIKILNSSLNYRKTLQYDPESTGCSELKQQSRCVWKTGISQHEIKYNGYLINDVLSILVIVHDI